MADIRPSFLDTVLRVDPDPGAVSFAGGLPNADLFPCEELADIAARVIRDDGRTALQYSGSAGIAPLREFIADRASRRFRCVIRPDEVLITTGSQQGMDLIGKAFVDPGDRLVVERPAYLGALEAFALYQPEFRSVPLTPSGISIDDLAAVLDDEPTFLYVVPNFQNPSGLTWTTEVRASAAALIDRTGSLTVEDDAFGELRFSGTDEPPLRALLGDRVIMLGSFSKITTPGLRVGWIIGPREIIAHLTRIKQAADLHTGTLDQHIIHRFVTECDLDAHLARVREAYKAQRDVMVAALERYFPPEASFTRPDGGLFLWVTLPQGISSLDLFTRAASRHVSFLPGTAFFVDGGGENELRLNFSNVPVGRIEEGVVRLAEAMRELG